MTTVTLGHLRNALHAGCASVVARVLDAHEVDLEFIDLDQGDIPELLKKGRLDLLVSAWMPRDEAYLHLGARILGTLYRPQLTLASYDASLTYADLPRQKIHRLYVPERFESQARALMKDLVKNVDIAVKVCDEEALCATVRAARQEGEPFLVLLNQPHALFHEDTFMPVSGAPLFEAFDACLLLRERMADILDQDLLVELSEMVLGNKIVSAIDHAIQVDRMDPEEAAEAWQRGRLVSR